MAERSSYDVTVIGAGLTGCACALSLARRGLRVALLERGAIGQHAASGAAAGILGAQLERHPSAAMQHLCRLSRERYPGWLSSLGPEASRLAQYRRSGSLRVALTEAEATALQAEVMQQRSVGLRADWLDAQQTRARIPALTREVRGGAWYPDDGVVDPAALLQVALSAAREAGVTVREQVDVERILFDVQDAATPKVRGYRCVDGTETQCQRVVITAGSWSTLIEGLVPLHIARNTIVPVRGQLVQLQASTLPFDAVIEGPGAYLSPRRDGRVLVGATVERVGFDDAVSPAATEALTAAAIRLVPALADATVTGSWCGFRAATDDLLPLFDETLAQGLTLCTGHFRNGVLLAPISGEIVEAAVLGEAPPPIRLAPFRLARLLEPAPQVNA